MTAATRAQRSQLTDIGGVFLHARHRQTSPAITTTPDLDARAPAKMAQNRLRIPVLPTRPPE